MEVEQKKTGQKENGEFSQLMYKYIPYWPLFVLLFLLFGAFAWVYIHFTTPAYEVTANILIKDERKGSDNPRAVEPLNAYASKKIVENEIEVLRSRELIRKVVNELRLYTSLSDEIGISGKSAFTTSPINIEVQRPELLKEDKKGKLIYDGDNEKVSIDKRAYPLNSWVNTPYGTLRFIKNDNLTGEPVNSIYFSLTDPNKVVHGLRESLDVSQTNKLSTVVTLKLRDEVPDRGKKILNELIDVYTKSAINEKNVLAANTLASVEDRIKYAVNELDSIEKHIQKYKAHEGISDLSEQGKLFLQNMSDNDRQLSGINMQLAVLDKVESLLISSKGKPSVAPSTLGLSDPVLTQLLQKLYDSEMTYERLKETTPDGNPMMFSLKNEIENIKPIILESIKTQKISQLASRNNLNSTNGMYASKIRRIPEKERTLLEISRQHAVKNDAYSFLLQKREETILSSATSVPDSRVVDWAEASMNPVSPRKKLIYLASFIVAFVLSVAYVNSKEFLSDKVLFRSEVENLTTIPVIAEVIKVKTNQPLIVDDLSHVFAAEQFRQLRAAIGLFGRNVKYTKVLVTSSISGEGKSFISSNLAASLALSGKKVLLLDMDMRNPRSSEIFNLENSKGIAEFLIGDSDLEEILYSTDINNLYLLPAGTVKMNTTELMLSGDVDKLFQSVQDRFDVLIIDAAPIDPVMDAFVLSEYCDFTLLVVRHRYTPKTMVQLLDENDKIKALKNSAIVLNCVSSRGFVKKGYGLGYGYGYMNVYGNEIYKTKKYIQ